MTAYYNEFEPYAAAMLRNLITAGHIADGVVDTRSIEDVRPSDLAGFKQCHFFAGVGVWSYALRRAGWPDDRPVWTGSCPCQPFSAAGKGLAFADERHLWPAFGHLIRECKPASVLGEQVASKDVDAWIDLVQADLEAMGYAFGSVPFPSAGVGAPHIRDRNYWVANTKIVGQQGQRVRSGRGLPQVGTADICRSGWLANADNSGRQRRRPGEASDGRDAARIESERLCDAGGLADAKLQQRSNGQPPIGHVDATPGREQGAAAATGFCSDLRPGPTNGYWRNADWLGCTDGKWRPVEPRPQSLVDGSAESLGRVCAEVAERMEGEIDAWAMESKISRAEGMRDLLSNLSAQAQRGWPTRGLPGLHEAPFLLAFMRQLQEQGWRIAEGVSLPCPEDAEAGMRVLRHDEAPASAPREHGLAGQQSNERADAVHFLSSLLARHAHTAWDHAYATYAEIGFPLAHGARSRVGRLRAYGNAINAEAARVFIEAVMECQP